MQDKELFEGTQTYLKSFFCHPCLGMTEFKERKELIKSLISKWPQKDVIEIFWGVLFWSIDAAPKQQEAFWSFIYNGSFFSVGRTLRIVKLSEETLPRIYDGEMNWNMHQWMDAGFQPDFLCEVNDDDFKANFGFMFHQAGIANGRKSFHNIYFKFTPIAHEEVETCFAGYSDLLGEMVHNLGNYVTKIPYKRKDEKALFKGQKIFLLAIRYFFRVFHKDNIPSLRQIKKYMLKNNLPNPFPTFWVR